MPQQQPAPEKLLDPGSIRAKVRRAMLSDYTAEVNDRDIKYLKLCIMQLWPGLNRLSETMIEPESGKQRKGLRILKVDEDVKSELWIEWIEDPENEAFFTDEDDDEKDSIVDEDSPNYGGTTQIVEIYRATRTVQNRSESEVIQKHGLKTFVNAIGATLDAKDAEFKRIAADNKEGKALVRQYVSSGRFSPA